MHPDRIDILRNLRVRFTQPNLLNDPFESSPKVEKIIEGSDFINNFQQLFTQDELSQIVDESMQQVLKENNLESLNQTNIIELISNFTKNNLIKVINPFVGDFLNTISPEMLQQSLKTQFSESFGVLSLTTNPTNLLMWSHYANSHKGFLIEFDDNHSFFDQRLNEHDTIRKLKTVVYTTSRPKIDAIIKIEELDNDEYLFQLMDHFFMTKEKIWEYEQEMRMIMPLSKSDQSFELADGEKIHLFSIPPDLIKRVIFGSQMSNELQNELRATISQSNLSHVTFQLAKRNSSEFKIDIIDV